MKHKIKKSIVYLVLISMMFFGGFPLPQANAIESITTARDLLSDSDLGATATHTITFTTTTNTPAGGDWRFTFPADFTGIAALNANCAYGNADLAETLVGNSIVCTTTLGQNATSTQLVLTGVVNPATSSSYTISLENRDQNDVVLDRVDVIVRIIDDVLMTAKVTSSMTFTVTGTTTTAVINGVGCDMTTTATTTDFGTLSAGASTTVCQILNVTTNASEGFIVTVEQSDELKNANNDTINSFNNSPDGTGSSTPGAWTAPTNNLDVKHTYGHMGLTSGDADLSSGGYLDFTGSLYVGFNGNNVPIVVFHHDGTSDGLTQNKGQVGVAYTAEIGSLQEAGEYNNLLTYIATPTF